MGFFGFLKRRKAKQVDVASTMPIAREGTSGRIGNLEELLALEEPQQIAIAIHEFLGGLTGRGSEMSQLTESQKVFLLVEDFETEINNGGFNQYFYNSTGDYAIECIEALKAIGRPDVAKLLERAAKQFPEGKIPLDRDKRVEVMESIEDKAETAWEKLDEKYYSEGVDLAPKLIDYVKAHHTEF